MHTLCVLFTSIFHFTCNLRPQKLSCYPRVAITVVVNASAGMSNYQSRFLALSKVLPTGLFKLEDTCSFQIVRKVYIQTGKVSLDDNLWMVFHISP